VTPKDTDAPKRTTYGLASTLRRVRDRGWTLTERARGDRLDVVASRSRRRRCPRELVPPRRVAVTSDAPPGRHSPSERDGREPATFRREPRELPRAIARTNRAAPSTGVDQWGTRGLLAIQPLNCSGNDVRQCRTAAAPLLSAAPHRAVPLCRRLFGPTFPLSPLFTATDFAQESRIGLRVAASSDNSHSCYLALAPSSGRSMCDRPSLLYRAIIAAATASFPFAVSRDTRSTPGRPQVTIVMI